MSVLYEIVTSMDAAELRRALQSAGVLTRADLLAAGVERTRIDTALRNGRLVRLSRGVYARADAAKQARSKAGGEHQLRVAGALAAANADVVVSHQSAARLQGIGLLDQGAREVTMTGSVDRGWHSRSGTHRYAIAVPPDHVTTAFGLPVTTPARTVVDLARTADFRAGVVAADSALFKKLTTKAELRAVVASLPRRPGIARAAEVVEFADMKAESPLESVARVGLRDSGLPPPELQIQLGSEYEPIGRVDFYWKQYQTAAEADGAMKYDADPGRARRQLRRDALLRAEGYEVVHFTWQDINFSPDLVAAWIRQAFRRQVGAGAAAGRQRAG
jgi:predicted transcriptional regulator of viral defense system